MTGVVVYALLMSVGCGGSPAPAAVGAPATVTPSVTISPTSVAIASGASVQFSAVVAGTTQTGITWLASAGNISATGLLVAPAVSSNTNVTVTAMNTGNDQLKSTATVSVAARANLAAQCVPPTYPCARTDTAVISLGALPNWGGSTGANTVFTDPAFNPYYAPEYVRVTDNASGVAGGDQYSGFAVGSGSGDDSHFSADDTLFWITDSNNALYVYGLNPNTMQTGLVWYSGGLLGSASWSQTNRNYLYTAGPEGKIYRYNFAGCSLGGPVCRPTSTLIYDFEANCNVNPNTIFVAFSGVAGSDNIFGVTYSAAGQDYGHVVAAYNVSSSTCYFYNTEYGTVRSYTGPTSPLTGTVNCNGTTTISLNSGTSFDTSWVGINFTVNGSVHNVVSVASSSSLTTNSVCPTGTGLSYSTEPGTLLGNISISDRYSVHDARIDPSGAWMIVELGSVDYSGSSQGLHAWKIGTTTVNPGYYQPSACSAVLPACDPGAAGGHYTTTASGWINDDQFYYSTSSDIGPGPNNPSLQYRTWANFNTATYTGATQLNTGDAGLASGFETHPTAKNDPLGTHHYPVFSSTKASERPAGAINYSYSNEVVGWSQTPGPVMRFGHTFNSSLSANFTAQYAIGAVSSTGKFYLFTTDGEGTLGNVTGGTSCSITGTDCRSDVFILNLAPPPTT